jgi:cytochrome c553
MISASFRVALLAALAAGGLYAQEPNARPSGTEFGFFTFQTKCMTCHGNPNVERAPLPSAIREMTPERIYEALTNGVMKAQGQSLSDPEKRTLALFIDFENLALGFQGSRGGRFDIGRVLRRMVEKGKIVAKKAYADWHGKGLELLGVSCDNDPEDLSKFLAENKDMPWPQLFDAKENPKLQWNPLAKEWGINGIPTMFLIDKKGILRSVMPGARMARMVATKLTAAVMVPTPLTIRPRAQKSVAEVRAKVRSVSGA